MKKLSLALGASAIALAVAAPAQAFLGYDVAEVRDMYPEGETFNEALTREYRSFALYEADRMVDWIDADYFAAKAIAASHGDTPMPEETTDRDLDAAHADELDGARTVLMAALADGRTEYPMQAARAQANFDCWMEQQEEGWQTLHIQACKQGFYDAIAAMKPQPEPQAAPPQYRRIEEGAVVYFDFDSSALRPDARQTLSTLASRLDDDRDIVVTVTGHADRAGSNEYNQALSSRRAATVTSAITELGLTLADVRDLEVEAKGETDPAVETADGVREQANRRVVVEAYAREPVGSAPTASAN